MIQPSYATNLKEVVEAVLDFSVGENANRDRIWFRGHIDREYTLTPSLYRYPKNRDEILQNESKLVYEFISKNYDLLLRIPEQKLLSLTLMQHYGTSTRLLDWSESLFSGLYFALYDDHRLQEELIEKVPCLWCLKPQIILKKATLDRFYRGDNISLPNVYEKLDERFDEETYYFNLSQDKGNRRNLSKKRYSRKISIFKRQQRKNEKDVYPVPFFSAYNSPRIRAQSGTFTLFPVPESDDQKSKDQKIYGLEIMEGAEKYLRKIDLVCPSKLREELFLIGIRESMFFPEMPIFAKEINKIILMNKEKS